MRGAAADCAGPDSPRFTMDTGLIAKPARFPQVEILLVAWRTVDHMPPLFVLLDVLEPRRSGGEVPKNIRSGATAPFWVGVRGLHRLLVLALQAIPFLLRRFALHVRLPLWQMPCWMQNPCLGFTERCL